MKCFKQVLLVTGTVIFFLYTNCQELKIGNKVPAIEFNQVYNYSSSILKFSDFKGKWMILDFWSIRCASCIKNFPKMDSLQKMFNDKIQIILVSEQGFDTAVYFFEKLKIKKPDLPIIATDTRLTNFFPHEGVPHLVWIDEDGKFYSATSSSNANVNTIKKLLSGDRIAFKQKVVTKKFESVKPLIASLDSISFDELLGYSFLVPGKVSFFQTTGIQKINGSKNENRIISTRTTILNLYKKAYTEGSRYNFDYTNSLILEVKDSSKFVRPTDESLTDKWEEENLYSYDLLVPASKSKQLYNIMQEDLERYFNIKGFIEKRRIQCLVLTRTTNEDKIATKGGKTYMAASNSDSLWRIRNVTFNSFVTTLSRILGNKGLPAPLIDKTGYAGNIDISWSKDIFDKFNPLNIDALKKALNQYGLDINFEEAETNVLVLRESL